MSFPDIKPATRTTVTAIEGRGRIIAKLHDGRTVIFDNASPLTAQIKPYDRIEGEIILETKTYIILYPKDIRTNKSDDNIILKAYIQELEDGTPAFIPLTTEYNDLLLSLQEQPIQITISQLPHKVTPATG